jgi:hypothetical protein
MEIYEEPPSIRLEAKWVLGQKGTLPELQLPDTKEEQGGDKRQLQVGEAV